MRIVTTLLAAAASACVVAVCLGLSCGRLSSAVAAVALVAGLIAGIFAWRTTPGVSRHPIDGWGWVVLGCYLWFTWRCFFWLIFFDGDQIKCLSPNNLGDLSLHLTYIEHLANGARFWPDNPIFAGQPLHYPLGVDLLNALLVLAGVEIKRSLVWVGVIGALLTLFALRRWGGTFAIAGFLFNGGIAGFGIISAGEWRDFQADLAWKGIPTAMLVTQRGLLFAVPAGLALLVSWRSRFFGKEDDWKMPRWLEWLLYASMPVFHVHTFLFLSALLGTWLVWPRFAYRKQVVELLVWSVVPATAATCLVTGGFGAGSGLHWKAGWMQGDQGFLWFWFVNFGVLPILVIALCVEVVRRKSFRAMAFLCPAVLLFIASCFVMLSTWEWDNTKLMLWCYLLILPFLYRELIAHWNLLNRTLCCFLLFASGAISLIGALDASHVGYDLADRREADHVRVAVRGLDVNAVFVAVPTYNQPLLLCGRKLAAGYDGHLWSHGIKYTGRWSDLERLMNGDADWRKIADDLHIDYLYWGPREESRYTESTRPWHAMMPIRRGTWGAIYDLHAVPAAPEPAPASASD